MKTSNENLKVSFYLKKKICRKGRCPVMGRITIENDMAQFSCKLEADPDLWDTNAGRMTGKSHHARMVNREIDKINVAVNAKYKEILSIRGQVTADEVKNAFQGTALSQETLLKVFREHNEAFEKRVGVNRAEKTYQNYQFGYVTLDRFIRKKYQVSDVSFRQLNYSFIENYDFYMRIDCRMAPYTVALKTTYLRKMVRIAIGRGIINHDPFTGYSAGRPKPSQKYVPVEELQKIMNTSLKSKTLDVTRDMFVFACYTGLSYIDLYNLSFRQIVKGNDGLLWLNTSRHKTDNLSRVPLLDDALLLIDKYRGSASGNKVFPMKSCGHMNRQLKKIAALCGIERRLTFHMSRHTFATETCLSQGVSIETVSKMMGHKSLSSTQIYAKVTHNKVNEDMQALAEILKDKYMLAS
jgi:integrase